MKQFSTLTVKNSKQFNNAIMEVFGSIASRNSQIQQLLVVATIEASRESGGQVTNNLSWLSSLLNKAEETKGINLTKLVTYVKEVLCCSTVSWDSTSKTLKKVKDKKVTLKYNFTPVCTWFDYGKKESVKAAFDYGRAVKSSIKSALNPEKGGLSQQELAAMVIEGGLNVQALLAFMDGAVKEEVKEEVKEVKQAA